MTAYTYVDTPALLEAAVRRLAASPILGVDTEAAGYHRYRDSLSLVQISSREETVLIDPLAVPDLAPLAALFSNGAIEKVFHDADFDLRILDRDPGLSIDRLFDTQIAAMCLGMRALGLGAVLQACLGIELEKAFQRADWAERPLSEGMKAYAAADTAHLPALRDALRERLVEAGRLAWAEEEFERRAQTRWTPPDTTDAFLRVKGAHALTRRALAVLREVHAWRESVAAERDQPPARVVGNEVLLQIARDAPTTTAALRGIRGLSPGLVDRRGAAMLAAIARGLAVPDADLPRYPRQERWERDPVLEARGERLREARNRVAAALDVDPGFLASRAALDDIARLDPASLDDLAAIPGLRRWQSEALGEAIVGVLRAEQP
ncbi:ribonuclease D [Luteitalea sp. TBR-22]|uniref:ribonuclease D n=1 Tax=Luteitalea sp. TBR-22 TaxID=2802971 RepID=UPI001AF558D9|nr:ribonuclease D [Luteitalea sp. TBR-22]BCS34945.1 ribonuclease D [Luteitalea sp. TBR-22]